MTEPKPEFVDRMKEMLGDDAPNYFESIQKVPQKIIRVNTLKTSKQKLIKRLKKKWKIKETPYENALIVESKLNPGELGKAIEHQTGLYYVQDLSSMMPPLALDAKEKEAVLDLCAAPGSKTTQISMMIKNKGTIIANDIRIDRIRALQSNLDRCGCTNVVVTRMGGLSLCNKFVKKGISFDKILVDAPCSGEGTICSDPKILEMWNPNMIKKLALEQKKLCMAAISCLKPSGVLVYSSCTHEPEENEIVVNFLIENFDVTLERVTLPLKTVPGLTTWRNRILNPELEKCHRIWPQDTNTEGFFIAKLRKK
jgi:NOL1/NOP2/sun family putative RNA methylase